MEKEFKYNGSNTTYNGFKTNQEVQQMAEMQSNGSSKADDNVIFVGQKPSMAYVLGVITQFSDGNNEVYIKARGKAISRAVDVAEIVRKRFLNNVQIKSIDIDTEERELEDKSKINVSTISIALSK